MSLLRLTFVVLGLIALCATVVVVAASLTVKERQAALDRQRSVAPTRHGDIEYTEVYPESASGRIPLLVIHGAGGGFDQGLLLAQAMAPNESRIISVSRFGYLGSALPSDPSTHAQAEAFVDLLDALSIERVDVLAMSGGAPPALKFAELFPERAGRLVLLSSAPFTPFSPQVEARPIPTWMYGALLGNDAVYWLLTKTMRNQLASAFDARADLRDGLSPEERHFISVLIDGFLPASKRLSGVNNEGAAVDPSASYDLKSILAPMLIVHAEDDRLNPVAIAERLHAETPNSEFVKLERGGHLLLGSHQRLRGDIDAFLHHSGGAR